MKEIKDDTNRWRDTQCSQIETINVVKITTLSKEIYRFNSIPIKLPMAFSQNQNKKFHNSYGNTKDPEQPKNLEKEEQNLRNQPSPLQTIPQEYSHQDSMILAQGNIDQWKKIESPEINPYTYGYHNFYKGGKNILWRKESLLNKWCWKIGQLHAKE